MPWVDMVGYAAALAVLGSFCMSTIVPLRILAIVSNVLFGAYGVPLSGVFAAFDSAPDKSFQARPDAIVCG